ncbi:DUF6935 domain-containing protein [Porphyromonas cangingivalis]|uniref:D-methionine transport system substrate-binding protein n=1 Tax=Porphyromonas cangingivalis TaxID=36874 RepID=A0A1T4JLZ8_PORCN|nr:hypothetical protein [Porphyromonas cangingivalis]SJZ31173.1 D-methionine transport system substrate-binding protein [Porphyromonas cangingivalis]VEJ04373.1 Uncharacterised protein [Porphyromonas cangingivalis]
MKRALFVTLCVFLGLSNTKVFASCTSKQSRPPIEVKMSGSIDHQRCIAGQKATVTFNRFPATMKEFEQVRTQIGTEPHGAVALQVMAYEMFRRDRDLGLKCIALNNVSNHSGKDSSPIRQLTSIFREGNSARPYQMASFLKGATPENGYNPTKPYTIEVFSDQGRGYEESNAYQTTVVRMYIVTSGRDDKQVPISVVKTFKPDENSNGTYFIVTSSPLYSRCKEKSFRNEFKGLD